LTILGKLGYSSLYGQTFKFEEWTGMRQKDMYTLDELYANLDISLSKLSKIAGVAEPTLTRIRDGYSARVETVNKILKAFSQVYGVELSRDNVTGIILEDKKAIRRQMLERQGITEKDETQPVLVPVVQPTSPTTTSPQKRTYKPRDTGLPEGCTLASDFAARHGIKRSTFYDHMLIGLGPDKERIDYSERDKPNRPNEKERYLTSEQQHEALKLWRRHGIAFTMPDIVQEVADDEPPWYAPEYE
jgi:predicted transcriptional regulator